MGAHLCGFCNCEPCECDEAYRTSKALRDVCQVQVWRDIGWYNHRMESLKPGDEFRIIRPDGSFHFDNSGENSWIANSEPFNCNGVYAVTTSGVGPHSEKKSKTLYHLWNIDDFKRIRGEEN